MVAIFGILFHLEVAIGKDWMDLFLKILNLCDYWIGCLLWYLLGSLWGFLGCTWVILGVLSAGLVLKFNRNKVEIAQA